MTPERARQIEAELELLTDDEDLRQDAWIIMLETSLDPTQSLERASKAARFAEDLARRVAYLTINRIRVPDTIEYFHPEEQSVMVLLMLGMDVPQILQYKGMCTVRFAQMLSCIVKHPCWSKDNDTEEKTLC